MGIIIKLLRRLMMVPMWVLCLVAYVFPRTKGAVVFGSYKDGFSDNAKYMFIHLCESGKKNIFWITGSDDTFQWMKEKGLPVRKRWSILGVWSCLRAEMYVFNCYVSDVNFFTSVGAKKVNLWHGIPLKKIERDVKSGVLAERYQPGMSFKKIVYSILQPEVYVRNDFLLAPSVYVYEYSFSSAFVHDPSGVIFQGYPRLDVLFWGRDERMKFIKKYEPAGTFELAKELVLYDDVIVYMPTWRDDGGDIFVDSKFDFNEMQRVLETHNALLIIKVHFNMADVLMEKASAFDRIRVFNPLHDIYPLLADATRLITDYSSIFFDFLVLRREMLFFSFDIEKYESQSRELYFRYEDIVPGVIATSFAELIEVLFDNQEASLHLYSCLKERFWGGYSGGAAEAIACQLCIGKNDASNAH